MADGQLKQSGKERIRKNKSMERKTKKWFWITGGILGFILVIAILSSGGEQINQETRQQAQQSQEAAINQLIQEI